MAAGGGSFFPSGPGGRTFSAPGRSGRTSRRRRAQFGAHGGPGLLCGQRFEAATAGLTPDPAVQGSDCLGISRVGLHSDLDRVPQLVGQERDLLAPRSPPRIDPDPNEACVGPATDETQVRVAPAFLRLPPSGHDEDNDVGSLQFPDERPERG